jgi:hypothetical protein
MSPPSNALAPDDPETTTTTAPAVESVIPPSVTDGPTALVTSSDDDPAADTSTTEIFCPDGITRPPCDTGGDGYSDDFELVVPGPNFDTPEPEPTFEPESTFESPTTEDVAPSVDHSDPGPVADVAPSVDDSDPGPVADAAPPVDDWGSGPVADAAPPVDDSGSGGIHEAAPPIGPVDVPSTPMPDSPARDFVDTMTEAIVGAEEPDHTESLTVVDAGAKASTKKGPKVGLSGQHRETVDVIADPDGTVTVSVEVRDGLVGSVGGRARGVGIEGTHAEQNVQETSITATGETAAEVRAGGSLPDWSTPEDLNVGDTITTKGFEGGRTEVNGSQTEGIVGVGIGGVQYTDRPKEGDYTVVERTSPEEVDVLTGDFDQEYGRLDTRLGPDLTDVFGSGVDVSAYFGALRDESTTTYQGQAAQYGIDEADPDPSEVAAYSQHLSTGEIPSDRYSYDQVDGTEVVNRDLAETRGGVKRSGTGANTRDRDVYNYEKTAVENRTTYVTENDTPIQTSSRSVYERRGHEFAPILNEPWTRVEVSDWLDAGGGWGQSITIDTEDGRVTVDIDDLQAAVTDAIARDPSVTDNPVIDSLSRSVSANPAFRDATSTDIVDAVEALGLSGLDAAPGPQDSANVATPAGVDAQNPVAQDPADVSIPDATDYSLGPDFDDGLDLGLDDEFDLGLDGGFDDGFDGGFDDGFDGGFDDGFDGGFDDGFDGGFDDGLDGGFDEGLEGGFDEGFEE